MRVSMPRHSMNFNPRSPHGERHGKAVVYEYDDDFNPRSPHGERLPPLDEVKGFLVFQPTLPARGATRRLWYGYSATTIFQPTLPARGATSATTR